MRLKFLIIFFVLFHSSIVSQSIIGIINTSETQKVVSGAKVHIEGTDFSVISDTDGSFKLIGNLPLGEQILQISHSEYRTKKFPIVIEEKKTIDLGIVSLDVDFKEKQEVFTSIDLSDEQLEEDNAGNQNQSLLHATRDPFLSSVAFNWRSTFFKVRGLGSEYTKVLVNGTVMNKFSNNRPSWSNWSGLNDILRAQQVSPYTKDSPYDFGGLLGVTNLEMRAGAFAKGSKVSIASTNRSYQGRVMATFHSGLQPSGWAYSISASARKATEGYIEGTNLGALSFFGSVEKRLNPQHSFSLSIIYTPIVRGRSSANTEEVTELKGIRYNPYWGIQNGKIRNSRIRKIEEPIATISHYWKPSEKLEIQTNLLFQFGKVGNSRLDYIGKTAIETNGQVFFEGTGRNPDPTYYQTLPSYFLRTKGSENYEAAFLADRNFRNNGQLNWQALYDGNTIPNSNATYLLYEDRTDDFFYSANSLFNYRFSSKIQVNGKVAFRSLKSYNYALASDLLGGSGYLDVDSFSEGDAAQNDLQNPNRIIQKGDEFRYNYNLTAIAADAFLQANYTHNKWNVYTAVSAEVNRYQREGIYENGHYPGTASLGKSAVLNLKGLGFKLGATRQITNKIYSSASVLWSEKPPTLRQSFTNPRQNNQPVLGLSSERNLGIDASINYQHGAIKSRISGYAIERSNSTNVSFFFTDNLAGLGRVENAGFFQEITTGIKTQNIGLEFGAEANLTSTLTLNASAAVGTYVYANNPNLYITSDSLSEPIQVGQTFLKNYHLAGGPQQAFGLGFSYRDPTYWWCSTQLNYYRNAYSNISPFTRTQNFVTDVDGLPFTDFDEARARELLQQERFPSYFLWNIIGGKSWKFKKKYLGVTLGVQNILNQIFKTGGFEQSRNSNYSTLNEDRNRENPLFESKYWYGSGTTFYVNTYLRF